MTSPVLVTPPIVSSARAMPKSITRGPTGGQQHVGRLEVAVHDPGRVDRGERRGHADGQRVEAGAAQRAGLAYGLVEVGAGDVFGDDVELVAFERGVEDGGRAEAAHPLRRVRLPAEPHAELLVLAELRVDHLDGDPLPSGILGEVDRAHPTPPQHA
ncbi:hypothetical protein GCM10020001_022100 [Nonomuraea salmonea]